MITKGLNAPDSGEKELGSFRKEGLAGASLSVCISTGGATGQESIEDGSKLNDLTRGSYAQAELQQIPLVHNSNTFHYKEGQTMNRLSRKVVESQYLEILKTQLDMTKLDAVNPTLKRGIRTRTCLDNLQRQLLTSMIL